MNFSAAGKWMIFLGLLLMVLGLLIWLGTRAGLPFGKLPGDLQIQKERFRLYLPLMSSLILSIFVTLVVNLIFWFLKK